MNSQPILAAMLRKFETRAQLDDADRQALLSLPHRVVTLQPHTYLSREGSQPPYSCLLISGFSYRQKLTVDGSRQILSVHVPGDFIDLESSLLNIADHNIQILTLSEVALVPHEAINALLGQHPRIARAMWIDTLIDSSIFREWITNVGRRDARTRIAHLLCEFARRLEVAGLADAYGYELPMTQEQLADATGLTAVHVNRVLKALDQDGLIVREKRFVRIPDWKRLRDVGGFSELYLHLDQMRRGYGENLVPA